MSRFYGNLKGNRGEATRQGTEENMNEDYYAILYQRRPFLHKHLKLGKYSDTDAALREIERHSPGTYDIDTIWNGKRFDTISIKKVGSTLLWDGVPIRSHRDIANHALDKAIECNRYFTDAERAAAKQRLKTRRKESPKK